MNSSKNSRSKKLLPLTIIGIPTLIAIIYLAFFARAQFEAETAVFIRSSEPNTIASGGILSLLAAQTNGSSIDNHILREYLRSGTVAQKVNAQFEIFSAWQNIHLDFLEKLPSDHSKDDALSLYRERLNIQIDNNGLITIRFRDFAPERSVEVVNFLLREGEFFVNQISNRLASEQVEFADQHIAEARAELAEIREKIRSLQNTNNLLDPTQETEIVIENIGKLEGELSQLRTELRANTVFLSQDSSQIRSLKGKIKALEEQITRERKRVVGNENSLNADLGAFQRLKLEEQFLAEEYASSYSFLQSSILEASRKVKSVVVVSPADVPTNPKYPRVLYTLTTTILLSGLIYVAIRIALTIIHEHN